MDYGRVTCLTLLLFTLAIHVLNSLIQRAVELGLLHRLTTRCIVSSVSLYADDAVVFCHPDSHDIPTIKELLRVFGITPGMHMNIAKCSTTPIRCTDEHINTIRNDLACPVSAFLVQYLGPPLSLGMIPTSALLPLMDKLDKKLSTWRGSMLYLGDRLSLVRPMLCAMPSHILIAIAINKPILATINQVIHASLWVGCKDARGGQCKVNWAHVCRPLQLGGLSVRDLHCTGLALRAQLIWLQRTDPCRPWRHLPLPCDPKVQAIVRASTSWQHGDGKTCLFWSDYWVDGRCIADLAPLVYALVPKRHCKTRTIRDGLHL